jgi:hypothetical protein
MFSNKANTGALASTGKTVVGTSQKPKCPKKRAGNGWLGKGIPAGFYDDGAGGGGNFVGGHT